MFLLKVSRPGLWFQTLWLYAVPLAGRTDWSSPALWVGLAYVTWPLNFLVYGWNDIVDQDVDRSNPRKDSWLFGARGSAAQLAALPPLLVSAQLVSALVLVWVGGVRLLVVVVAIAVAVAIYNAPVRGLRRRPPFDLINPLGYLLVVQLAVWLNGVPPPPWPAWGYLAMFCVHAQLMGEIMDYHVDRAAGRSTTGTRWGVRPTKLVVAALVGVEAAVLGMVFGDWWLAGVLFAGVLWLLLDALVLYRDRQYTRTEFTLAGLGMNALGLGSMVWVWWQGSLAQPLPAF